MEKDEAAKGKGVLDADDLQMVRGSDDVHLVRGLNRRDFMKYSVGAIASLYLGSLTTACGGKEEQGGGTFHGTLLWFVG